MVGAKSKKSLLSGLFIGLALMLTLTSPALAVETHWDGPAVTPGNEWSVPENWNPKGVPVTGDEVFIDQKDANVLYLNSSNPKLNFLQLGLVPSDPLIDPNSWIVALTQYQDILTVKNTEIGSKGTAEYFHNGGTHKVIQDLTLGTAKDGEGNYYLGGGPYRSAGMKRWA